MTKPKMNANKNFVFHDTGMRRIINVMDGTKCGCFK